MKGSQRHHTHPLWPLWGPGLHNPTSFAKQWSHSIQTRRSCYLPTSPQMREQRHREDPIPRGVHTEPRSCCSGGMTSRRSDGSWCHKKDKALCASSKAAQLPRARLGTRGLISPHAKPKNKVSHLRWHFLSVISKNAASRAMVLNQRRLGHPPTPRDIW